MKRSEILFGILRVPVDALMVVLALLLAYHIRSTNVDLIPVVRLIVTPSKLPAFPYYALNFVVPAALSFLLISALLRLYSLRTTLGPWREISRVMTAALLWLALVIAWYFLIIKQLFFSRALLIEATVLIMVFTVIGRAIVTIFQRCCLRYGIGTRTVLSCGMADLPGSIRTSLQKDIRFRYAGHVRTSREVMEHQKATVLDLVLHTDPNPTSTDTADLIDFCRSHHIGYTFLPSVFVDVPHQLSIGTIGFVPVLKFEPTPLDGWGRVWKRAVDLFLGLILLLVACPFMLLIGCAILITCGFPIFYVSRRVAQYGRVTVPLLKFRTMCVDADARKGELLPFSHRQDGPLFKIKDDPRVTPIGKSLRRFSLDELPQLLNVVLGHLALVGPRPHLPEEVARYTRAQRRVLSIRPGITGLAQISGRSDLKFEDEVALDMRYIEDWSLLLDFWILWRTLWVVVFGRGAE